MILKIVKIELNCKNNFVNVLDDRETFQIKTKDKNKKDE